MIRSRLGAIACLALALSFGAACDKSAIDEHAAGDSTEGSAANHTVDRSDDARLIPEISIATYNVNWGNRDAVETAQIIRDADADLVCIQESRPELEAGLKRELRREYPTIIFRGDKEAFPAERFGFLSKHPVRRESYLPARHGIFGSWIIEIDFPVARDATKPAHDKNSRASELVIQVANVHLEPVRPPEEGKLLTVFQVFADTEKVHAEEIAWIHEQLSSSLPTIVAGDFNSLSSGAAPAFLRKQGFVDSFAAVTESPDTHATWRWPTRWIDLAGRIDYIFHSSHFRTVESRAAERTTSDHWLVVSKLEWRSKTEAK